MTCHCGWSRRSGSTGPRGPTRRSGSRVLLSLGGCSNTGADEQALDGRSADDTRATAPAAGRPPPDDGISVLRPGEPGESAETAGIDAVRAAPEPTHTDTAFVQMMVPHHGQALEMARLAQTRASSGSVKALARRIEGAQGPSSSSSTLGWRHTTSRSRAAQGTRRSSTTACTVTSRWPACSPTHS